MSNNDDPPPLREPEKEKGTLNPNYNEILSRKNVNPSKSIEKISSDDVADLTAKLTEVSSPIETQKIETSVSPSISLPQTIEGVTFTNKDPKASLNCKSGEVLISYEIIPKKIVNDTEVIKNQPSKDLTEGATTKSFDGRFSMTSVSLTILFDMIS